MPVRVDHDARRTQIIDGLLALAADRGLGEVTMRGVADAAGVSLRLVQYYFGTKELLIAAAMDHLARSSEQRLRERVDALTEPVTSRALIEAYLAEALPDDPPSRQFHLVFRAFLALAATTRSPLRSPADGVRINRNRLLGILTEAAQSGELTPGHDPALETDRLMALEHGIGTGILIGLYTPQTVAPILAQHLDELFTA
ncbi:TetR family transcriptional regulator [Gordonia amarae]|uniref:TetR family transcriptional regulator n=2 Tax=Gordonia amarae TaxID=36821 RepID=A0A857KF33_9ACTN|nr:TetR/AcrR family transcriptional regulator [Gordonia amarae]MCS3877196.1 AcrR family transcriptional regulator [Gordonia amarae]QHN15979.1 TetR family transcriptional regulator [Gordonia amarae]QHN20547.1 TetR family transcriptional regulator [Gordonia amarae]QHN29400.1 TetR family transcriptional regulator [Gordonia amarae]QHN38176.1 TetR family transcriptional regulator [Gordonia amarae]